MGFTKLDNGIVDSSIWDEPSNVLKVFVAFWTKSNPEGVVNATYNAMFRAANLCDDSKNPLPIEDFDRTLNVLLSPDQRSRSKDDDGRRIVRLEESRWLIVNYKKYRETTYSDNPESVRKRSYRESKDSNGTSWDMSQSVPGHSASASASGEEKRKESREKERETIPPTLEDVGNYCRSRQNGINPQSFHDFYSSRGWMIGKVKMKSWTAAVRTWENRRREEQAVAQAPKPKRLVV